MTQPFLAPIVTEQVQNLTQTISATGVTAFEGDLRTGKNVTNSVNTNLSSTPLKTINNIRTVAQVIVVSKILSTVKTISSTVSSINTSLLKQINTTIASINNTTVLLKNDISKIIQASSQTVSNAIKFITKTVNASSSSVATLGETHIHFLIIQAIVNTTNKFTSGLNTLGSKVLGAYSIPAYSTLDYATKLFKQVNTFKKADVSTSSTFLQKIISKIIEASSATIVSIKNSIQKAIDTTVNAVATLDETHIHFIEIFISLASSVSPLLKNISKNITNIAQTTVDIAYSIIHPIIEMTISIVIATNSAITKIINNFFAILQSQLMSIGFITNKILIAIQQQSFSIPKDLQIGLGYVQPTIFSSFTKTISTTKNAIQQNIGLVGFTVAKTISFSAPAIVSTIYFLKKIFYNIIDSQSSIASLIFIDKFLRTISYAQESTVSITKSITKAINNIFVVTNIAQIIKAIFKNVSITSTTTANLLSVRFYFVILNTLVTTISLIQKTVNKFNNVLNVTSISIQRSISKIVNSVVSTIVTKPKLFVAKFISTSSASISSIAYRSIRPVLINISLQTIPSIQKQIQNTIKYSSTTVFNIVKNLTFGIRAISVTQASPIKLIIKPISQITQLSAVSLFKTIKLLKSTSISNIIEIGRTINLIKLAVTSVNFTVSKSITKSILFAQAIFADLRFPKDIFVKVGLKMVGFVFNSRILRTRTNNKDSKFDTRLYK